MVQLLRRTLRQDIGVTWPPPPTVNGLSGSGKKGGGSGEGGGGGREEGGRRGGPQTIDRSLRFGAKTTTAPSNHFLHVARHTGTYQGVN
ncbi:unnamed protein product [Caenorhabditis auriculariae]|uniref:Uncharacterized protein n=1 Tax=Caenorhabditis auriculariae TaxID=2777116 RepID=A0A8S1HBM8_9PELO|nr:unnamed protein product [Caenorhabditis auriculariae]